MTTRRLDRHLVWLVPLIVGLAIGLRPSMDKVAVFTWVVAMVLVVIVVPNNPVAASSISPVLLVAALAIAYGMVVPLDLLRRQDTFLLGIDYRPWFWAASATAALSTACFTLGYALPRQRAAPSATAAPRPRVDTRPALEKLGRRMAVAAGLLFLYRVARYGLGGWAIKLSADRSSLEGATAYITYAPQYLAGLALFLWHITSRAKLRALYGAIIALLTFYFFASGVRYLVIVMLGSAFLLYYWRSKARAIPRARYLAGAIVVGVVVLGVGGNLRAQASGGATGFGGSTKESFEIFLPMAGLIAYTEHHGYDLGSSYTYLAYQVIPRSIWSSKPFPPTYDAIAAYTDIREGRSFPLWGELFLNFGWYGVAGGMLAFGYGMRKWMMYWLRTRTYFVCLDCIAAVTIPLIVQWVSRGLFVQLVYNTMGLLIGPLLLLWYERILLRRNVGSSAPPAEAPPAAPAPASASGPSAVDPARA